MKKTDLLSWMFFYDGLAVPAISTASYPISKIKLPKIIPN